MADEPGRGNDGEHPDRQEDADGGQRRPWEAGDQKSDEGHRDDDRSRRDHGDRHGVEKLLFAQPPELAHHALIEEGHDGQAAAEDECAGFREEEQDLPQDTRLGLDDRGRGQDDQTHDPRGDPEDR